MLSDIFRALTSLASGRRRFLVLTKHRVVPERDPLFPGIPTQQEFKQLVECLSRSFHVMTLAEAMARQEAQDLPPLTVVITFDDGYEDNISLALPVLQQFGVSATFFVAAGFLEGTNMWNDRVIEAVRATPARSIDLHPLGLGSLNLDGTERRRAAVLSIIKAIKHLEPEQRSSAVNLVQDVAGITFGGRLMMSPDDLRGLHTAGMEIGGHTITHPILCKLSLERAAAEITGGKAQLETLLGSEVTSFAYPNGIFHEDYSAANVDQVQQAGFQQAVSTHWGSARAACDRFQLPRVAVMRGSQIKTTARLIRYLFD